MDTCTDSDDRKKVKMAHMADMKKAPWPNEEITRVKVAPLATIGIVEVASRAPCAELPTRLRHPWRAKTVVGKRGAEAIRPYA